MALRLNEWVTCGELVNTRKNSVCGWLKLRGVDRPISLQLTGNCSPDLAGRHIRFEVQPWPDDESSEPCESEREQIERIMKLAGLAWQQVGPTGVMTAKRKVRDPDCPLSEWFARNKEGEPPPLTWKPCLFLEWFSQNGRAVFELVDPVIEFVGSDPEPPPGQEDPDAEPTDGPDAQNDTDGGLSITSLRLHDDDEVEIRDETPFDEMGGSPEDCDNAYGLIDDELQRSFDAQARDLDRSLQSNDDPETNEVMREIMLMDDLIERGEGEPLGTLFDDVVKLSSPDKLDKRQAADDRPVLQFERYSRLARWPCTTDCSQHRGDDEKLQAMSNLIAWMSHFD
ncbi:MAG: hypothetical protein JXA69_01895 [Phycisphaerae bacterium]|nr:hypothetical protein [Phycisphaerae bacterium]